MTHRLFIGIRPPENVRDALIDLMDGVDDARWQSEDQLHLTLRFVGDVETHSADDLAETLSEVRFSPFDIVLRGTGIFERKGRATTLWAGVEPSPELLGLQKKVERRCVAVGLPPETRKFHPHITIARLNTSTGPVGPFLARTAEAMLGAWCADSYILFESHLRTGGSVYEPIVRYSATEQL